MNQFKRAKVVMLPTNEKAIFDFNQIIKHDKGKLHIAIAKSKKENPFDQRWTGQHLYIISDDEIKEGDWIYNNINKSIEQVIKVSNLHYIKNLTTKTEKSGGSLPYTNGKKIIATTDSSLQFAIDKSPYPMEIHCLPQPSQQFIQKYIEEYNKGNIIVDVLVEYEEAEEYDRVYGHADKFPRLLIKSKDNTITIKRVKESWDREEVIKLIEKCVYKKQSAWKVGELDKFIEENLN